MAYSPQSKKEIMLILQDLAYCHPDKELLFQHIYLTAGSGEKLALVGNNGTGKSTLLKLIAGALQPSGGQIIALEKPYYVPQVFGQFNHLTVAQALGIHEKVIALQQILSGNINEQNLTVLDDDWTIEERCREALNYWKLPQVDLQQSMDSLSGGQKVKVFLAGISLHQPGFVLLDEPTNHLDIESRQILYDLIRVSSATFIVVSHDRTLLNLLDTTCELSSKGIACYGGNYDFYTEQKNIEKQALVSDVQNTEKALRKAEEKRRETLERQARLNARGKKKQEKAGVAKIMMNTLRNSAENSTAKAKSVHTEKMEGIATELKELRAALPDIDQMKLGFDYTHLHKGKILFTTTDINFKYGKLFVWNESLSLQINSGDRIALKGANGSGKTTLIRLLLGELQPATGTITSAIQHAVYIDQEYSLIQNNLSVYEQAQLYNNSGLQQHEIKIRLARFLFNKEDWDKRCSALSGGERMRLILCCLTIGKHAPDIIILDEPTNNLDIQNIEILTGAIRDFKGALLIVSHDITFLKNVGVEQEIIIG